ncbi:MAG: hypothetical protein K2K06_04980 [Oscillospiraceae bacterium]|nr:hypothetical protein [Oscillospiraceae bacterium]
MAKMNYKGKPVHVYVMRSIDGLVKVGIAKNVIARAASEYLEDEKKEIVGICYSTEKIDMKTARIYEAALLGFHRKYIINGSEWLTAQWRSVTGTLENMLNGQTIKIQTNGESQQSNLNDEFMKSKGYTRKYLGKYQRVHYLKCENGICKLVNQVVAGGQECEVCSLHMEEMMDYLTENDFKLIKKL